MDLILCLSSIWRLIVGVDGAALCVGSSSMSIEHGVNIRKFTSNAHHAISFNRVESTALPSFRTIYNRITGTRIVVRISACACDEMRIADRIKGPNPTDGFPENALKPQQVNIHHLSSE